LNLPLESALNLLESGGAFRPWSRRGPYLIELTPAQHLNEMDMRFGSPGMVGFGLKFGS
jgi:hypothetical protein